MNENTIQQHDDEIDLTVLFKNLLKQRGLIIAFALAFMLLGGAFQFSKLALYVPKQISYPIAVDFASATDGHYPNGSAFAFSDLIAPENIKDALKAAKLNIKPEAITESLSIDGGNVLFTDTEEKLLARLNDKKLPEDQVAEVRKALVDLRDTARVYATLSLDLSKLKLSTTDAQKLLKQIVSSWADNALKQGLISPNISYPKESFIYDKNAVIIDNYDQLVVYGRNLQSAFAHLSELSASDTVSVDGQNLNDLTRKIKGLLANDIHVMRAYAYSISPALIESNPLLEVQIFSQRRVKDLTKEELEKKIKAYDEVLAQLGYRPERANLGSQVSLKDEASETSLDKSILNELLNLGSKLSSSELRTEIVNRRIRTAEELFAVEREIAMIEGNASSTQSSENQRQIIASMPKIFEKSVNEINALQKTFVAILAEYKKINLNKSSSLYSAVADAYVANPWNIPLKKTLITLIAAMMVGLCLGVVVALMRSALSAGASKN